jgi:D-3-phosphoglycerate dehydrogenase
MLYQSCDIISINIPATKETKQSINAELLQLLPKGAVLVNTARKEVVHEADMVQFMESRPDVKYVTDVMPDNHAEMLEKFPTRYFATAKKMGAQTSEANINAGIAAAKQIVGFLKTGNDKFRVN